MPLKPIYGKAPLTSLKGIALRPGQVHMNQEKLTAVYDLLCQHGKDCVAAWEPAFRAACILNQKPLETPVSQWIHACADAQAEDGALPVAVESAVDAACAMMAVYEYRPERAVLEKLMRWCAWAGANWAQLMACADVRVRPANLMALLCQLYRITGKKGLIRLCGQLRQDSMDWSSVLHTFSVQRPMKRMIRYAELESGMADENHHEAGFYTRQYLTCHGETLADGARAALMSSVYSGNGQEASAAAAGWEKISRWHGAVCGGVTADGTLGGLSPACAVDAASLGAWAEAFAAQVQLDESAAIGDALERIVYNGLPAAVLEGGLVPYQRVNGLRANCGTRDCYDAKTGEDDALHALCRVARGWTAAMQSAVCATAKGAQMNLYLPGVYALSLGETAVRMTVSGHDGAYEIRLSMKQDAEASIAFRAPAWTDDGCVTVNDEGGYEAKKNTYLTLERRWHDGDVIRVEFARSVQTTEGYHQSVSVRYGEHVMVCPVTEADWAYALTGVEARDGQVFAMVKRVPGWKCAHGVPGDMPVLPETTGEAFEVELKPYADAPCRLAAFPKA